MFRNNVPLKVAIGYGVVAAVLVIGTILVYSNTRSLMAINESVREYTTRQEQNDSAMAQLLSDEQANLKQLNDVLDHRQQPEALRRKVRNLYSGADSVVVKPKSTEEHHVAKTTIEVAHTRKGFFRRFADLFRRSHADTVSIKRDSTLAGVDTVAKPVDISHKVAKILDDADREERNIAIQRHRDVKREMDDLKALTAYMTHEQTKKMETLRQKESKLIHQDMEKAMKARQRLVMQIILLSCLAIATALILFWRIYRDSKREREYRGALEQANAETRRLMEQREQLLLTITHDIKAPAASITGFTELLKEYISSPKGIELLGNVHDSAVHLSQLVASLLDYHQLENGQIKVNNTVFSPARLATQCVMGMKPRAESKELTIKAVTDDCESISCRGDAFRIRQIIDNLLSNAVKYTDKGGVVLTVSVSNSKMLISVKDTGKGISKDKQKVIFEAFKRLGNAQGIEGTGLGLSIVSQLVSLLGGEIKVKSEVGKGSNFSVSLPIYIASEKEEGALEKGKNVLEKEENALEKEETVSDDEETKTFRNNRLLILDDDPLQLKLLQEVISHIAGNSWQVTACNHITDALTCLHDKQPALMFMDIEMPEMSGIDFISHIDHHDMTVIAMTAHDESIIPTLRAAGFDGCLFKPVKADEMAEILGLKGKNKDSSPTSEDSSSISEDFSPASDDSSSDSYNSLLVFAGDDEDSREIMETLNAELSDFRNKLIASIRQPVLDREAIGGIAHKLLPLAKMLNLSCITAIESLTPEKISSSSDDDIKKAVEAITAQLPATTLS